MSYRRTYTKTITVPYSGSVSYPSSQSGGSVSYNGRVSETVNITIDVDTDPFDSSVSHCASQVNVLTGAVAAAEAAEVASISMNAKKVGDTIIAGFFKTVGSEISQQISELNNEIDGLRVHLAELRKRCQEKQTQMGKDYNRLLERYTKVFDELDRELDNRVHMLDRAIYEMRKRVGATTDMITRNDTVNTVVVSGNEGAHLHTTIAASKLKKTGQQALNAICNFLVSQRRYAAMFESHKVDGLSKAKEYAPSLTIETTAPKSQINRDTYAPESFFDKSDCSRIKERAAKTKFSPIDADSKEKIEGYINDSIRANIGGNDAHSQKVRDTMRQLMNFDIINK